MSVSLPRVVSALIMWTRPPDDQRSRSEVLLALRSSHGYVTFAPSSVRRYAYSSARMSRFNWDDLRFFLAVARAGRLTVAARRLGADHATVSRRITALEEALKAKLFERRPQGYALTPHGERLIAAAETIESAALGASSEIGGADLALSGSVRVGVPDGFGTVFLAPRVPKLAQTYPELEIQLAAMPRLLSLSKREADIAIRPMRGNLVTRRLAEYRLGLFASQSYLESQGEPMSASDLTDHKLIGYIPDLIYADELRYHSEISDGLEPDYASSSINIQHRMTAGGLGVCVLPLFLAGQDSQLVRILPEIVITRSFWLVVHRDLRNVARVRALTEWLGDILAATLPKQHI